MSRSSRSTSALAMVLIAVATAFTVGRSLVVARNGMQLTPQSAQAPGGGRIVAASSGPDMQALDRDREHADPMRTAPVEQPRASTPAPVTKAPAPGPSRPAEELRLVGQSSDFAILRDAAGDHSLRIGARLGKYTLRQINGATVVLETDNGHSITLSQFGADR